MTAEYQQAIAQKLALRFRKDERIRYISHHDLMRAFMRAARRARLPVRHTGGFNPRPRIILPHPVETGADAMDEILQIELIESLHVETVVKRLNDVLPDGLDIIAGKEILPVKKSGTVKQITYRVHCADASIHIDQDAIDAFLAADSIPYSRIRNNKKKNVDLRRPVTGLTLDGEDLIIGLSPTSGPGARPLDILAVLAQCPIERILGVRTTRVHTEWDYGI